MVRSGAPIGQVQDEAFFRMVFIPERGTGEDVIDPAVGLLFAEIMCPDNATRFVTWIWIWKQIAISLFRSRVEQSRFASTQHGVDRFCRNTVVEVTEDDQVSPRLALKKVINFLAQKNCF